MQLTTGFQLEFKANAASWIMFSPCRWKTDLFVFVRSRLRIVTSAQSAAAHNEHLHWAHLLFMDAHLRTIPQQYVSVA